MLIFISLFLAVAAIDIPSALTGAGINAVFPSDNSYAKASEAYNLRFTVKPAAVTYPSSADEVAAIVKAAAANNVSVVARSGGHSYVANSLGGADGAIVVDLSNMTSISVDPSTNVATIETGNRLGGVALALNKAGRALPHGTCPYVGIGGHSGHGGFGYTSRMWGLTLDTITSMNVVLANGSIVTASNSVNSDLFWAMRGSASSFGIMTSITTNTFAAPASAVIFQYEWQQIASSAAADALAAFQDFVQTNIPAQLGVELIVGKGQASGGVYLGLSGGWYGDKQALNSTLQPFLNNLPTPSSLSYIGNGTYIDSVSALGGGSLNTNLKPDINDTFYAKSLMTPEARPLTPAARTAFMNYLATDGFASNLNWFMEIELYGGSNSAINAVPSNATAFVHRSSMFTLQLYASSPTMSPPFPDSGFTFLDDLVGNVTSTMPSNWDYGAYINYLDNRLQNWQTLYYGDSYDKLKSIKAQVDPTDVFRFPISVEEEGSTGSSGTNTTNPNGSGTSNHNNAASITHILPYTLSLSLTLTILLLVP